MMKIAVLYGGPKAGEFLVVEDDLIVTVKMPDQSAAYVEIDDVAEDTLTLQRGSYRRGRRIGGPGDKVPTFYYVWEGWWDET